MVVMKRRSVRVVLALLVLILAGTFFLAAQPETPSASSLESLLNGSSTDIPGALSSLNDADLPLALAVAEALKFKALHGDTKIPAEAVEEFQQAVTGRIGQSRTVSFAKSEACPIAVPARKATLAGLELTVPACFRAEQPLAVLDSGPRNEAGTLFPECWVSFVADKRPVQIRMTVDGKVVPTSLENDRLAVFRPPLSADGVFSLGTHTVSVILTDAGKNQASASWSFSIGASPSPADPPPGDATIVASITMEIARIAPGSRFPGLVTINILTDKTGKRYFEYLVFPKGVTNRGCYRTSSLWMLQKTLGGGSNSSGFYLFIATPKTEYAFEGNKLFFATDFRPNPDAVWTIDKTVWKIGHGESQETIEGSEISLTMGKSVLDVDVSVFYTYSFPEFPDQVSHWDLFAWTSIYPIRVNPSVGVSRHFELVDNFKETAISIEASRRILGYFDLDLKEGSENPISEGAGTIFVKKSHWKTVSSSGTVTIADPLATATKAIFKTPGIIELVNEIELTLDWQGEKYDYTYVPEESALVGIFPASGSVEYEKFPKGIIFDTSRLIRLKSLQVEIDKVKRKFAKSEELFLDPPWVLAKSTLFPESLPLGIVALHPAHFFDQFDTVIMPDEEDGFLTKLNYDDPALETEGNLITRAYLGWDELGRKGQTKRKKAKAVEGLLPLSKAQKIMAFPNPADLLDVEIVPPAPPPIGQNQKVDFSGSIVAKPQMGNGRITATGGEINLLDGYVSQAVDALEWSATLKEETSKGKGIDFAFQFEPKEGTGTYEIRAGTTVRFEEEDTETEAGVIGSSTVNLTVTEGFQIKSPVAGFAYPLKHPVPVRTNIDPPPDSDQNLDLWRKIVWALNKEQWIPPSDRPPISFTPDKAGEWALAGEIKENGLRDEVKFQVKPITVRVSPTRKVVPLSTKTVPLALAVKLGEAEVTSWGQEVTWVPGLMKAKVEAVEWKAFTSPTTEKPLAVSNPPLKAEVTIDKEGPLTILATITVRIWSTNPQKPYDETFVIPAARADLWAVAPPFWNPLLSTLPDEQFPKKAVSPAGRTFTIKEGSVSFEGKDVSWNPQSGLSSPIEIQPAIPSSEISPATADKVRLAWSCPGNDPSDSFTYAPAFEKPVETVVKLQSFLVFDEGTDIEFTEKKFTVDVEDINNLVEYYVNPKSFQMTIGEAKPFSFFIKPLLPVPAISTGKSEFDLQNDGYHYRISLESVEWHYEIASNTSPFVSTLEYIFTPPDVGNYKISATAKFWIVEFPFSATQIRWPWSPTSASFGFVRELFVQIFGNGVALDLGDYHLGQKISLSYKVIDRSAQSDGPLIDGQKWVITPPTPKEFFIAEDKKTGRMVPVPESDFNNPSFTFGLYDFYLSEENGVGFGKKTGVLLIKTKGKEFPYPFVIEYKKPYLSNFEIKPPEQGVKVAIDPEDLHWKIGFHQRKKVGISARSDIHNPTKQAYLITFTGLIQRDNKTQLLQDSNTKTFFKKTVPAESPISSKSEFWLDTWLPGWDNPEDHTPPDELVISRILYPEKDIPDVPIADDLPLFELVDPVLPGTPKNYFSDSSFIVTYWVKPAPLDDSIWCPIKRMIWRWGGNTEFDPTANSWVDNENNYFFDKLQVTPVEFPDWSGWAHPKLNDPVTPESPPWREQER